MRLQSSAPGKMVLIGEYAVLFGHPAVVAAVNRRAEVRLDASGDHTWSVSAPGIDDGPARFTLDRAGGFSWVGTAPETAERLRLVEGLLEILLCSGELTPERVPPAKLTLDTRAFFLPTEGGPVKLGLGSSAALTVAAAEALRAWERGAEITEPMGLDRLLDLHCGFQGGRGSGIDVGASALGGVLEYRLAGDGRSPEAVPTRLPTGVRPVAVWTGKAASTSSFLERLDAALKGRRGGVHDVLDELGRESGRAVACLRSGDAAGFVAGAGDYGDTLERLGDAAGIPILSPEHRRLRELARQVGVAYKPSGAGGGDVGIGFTTQDDTAEAFAERAAAEGFPRLDLEIDPRGVGLRFSAGRSEDDPC
ncbi:MAG: hypothetical protein V2I67_15590 [Thermoanaerobaculales bacterium]|jgi:phosphomevalonate kinase|nr:hypothetical protein [Thermoanaerobaculales bacterium]